MAVKAISWWSLAYDYDRIYVYFIIIITIIIFFFFGGGGGTSSLQDSAWQKSIISFNSLLA